MYTSAGIVDKKDLVEQYAPMVKRIAAHLILRLPPSVQLDDMVQAGMIGLLDAIDRYEATQGAQFETYAAQRIRGAMMDELREADWVPRRVRRNLRRIENAMNALEQKLGRPPTEGEIAASLSMGLAEYQETLGEARGSQLLHFSDMDEEGDGDFLERHAADEQADPLHALLDTRLRQALVQAIERLPEREKTVLGLYFEQEMTLREIGEVLGVSESRVCQLYGQAMTRLRGRLKNLHF